MVDPNPTSVLPLHPYGQPDILEFSPDGLSLAAAFSNSRPPTTLALHASPDADVILLRSNPLDPSAQPRPSAIPAASRALTSLAWSHDSSALFAAYAPGTFRSWSVPADPASPPTPGPDFSLPDDSFTCLAATLESTSPSPQPTLLAFGTSHSGVRLVWIHTSPGTALPIRLARAEWITLAVQMSDPSIEPVTFNPPVSALAWIPRAPVPTLTAALSDGRVALWRVDARSGSPGGAYATLGPTSPYAYPPLRPKLLYCLWPDGFVHPVPHLRIAWSPQGTLMAAVGTDRRVSVWEPVDRAGGGGIVWRRWYTTSDGLAGDKPLPLVGWISGQQPVLSLVLFENTARVRTVTFPTTTTTTSGYGLEHPTVSPLLPLPFPSPPIAMSPHPLHSSLVLSTSTPAGFGSTAGSPGLIAALRAPSVDEHRRVDEDLADALARTSVREGEVQMVDNGPVFGATAFMGGGSPYTVQNTVGRRVSSIPGRGAGHGGDIGERSGSGGGGGSSWGGGTSGWTWTVPNVSDLDDVQKRMEEMGMR